MDNVEYTAPIRYQREANSLETAMSAIFRQAFEETLGNALNDLLNYGAPFLGSPTVVERFTKQDGLVVLRRPDTSAKIMRIIYANWTSLASETGLGFLKFVLQMLWPDQWQVYRLYHSKAAQDLLLYPFLLVTESNNNNFLTSRIRVMMDASIDVSELAQLAPVLKRLVPAHIVSSIALPISTEDMGLGVAVGLAGFNIADHTPEF